MSTERERLIAASMLKQLLSDRVADQVDPVEYWETELDFRLSRAQFGPIREIAQSLVEAIDRLSGNQGEDAQDLLEGEDKQLKSWMGDQSDDVRRAIIRAVQRPAPARWR